MFNQKGKDKYAEKQYQMIDEKLDRFNAFLSNDEMQDMKGKKHQILVIEDSLADVDNIRKMLESSKIKFEMMVINNGQDAISFLERESQWENMPIPDLIIIDLNLPKISGGQILNYLKKNTYLSWIPRVAITSDASKFSKILNKEHQNTKIVQKPFAKLELFAALASANPLMYTNLAM
jgi:CheY-like chemotaxis protein